MVVDGDVGGGAAGAMPPLIFSPEQQQQQSRSSASSSHFVFEFGSSWVRVCLHSALVGVVP